MMNMLMIPNDDVLRSGVLLFITAGLYILIIFGLKHYFNGSAGGRALIWFVGSLLALPAARMSSGLVIALFPGMSSEDWGKIMFAACFAVCIAIINRITRNSSNPSNGGG